MFLRISGGHFPIVLLGSPGGVPGCEKMQEKTIEYYHKNSIPIKWDELTLENREKLIEDIVKNKGYARVISLNKKDVLDMTTANAIKTVKDALNTENKNKFLSYDLYKVVSITWKLVN